MCLIGLFNRLTNFEFKLVNQKNQLICKDLPTIPFYQNYFLIPIETFSILETQLEFHHIFTNLEGVESIH